jgi:hypothetical protein
MISSKRLTSDYAIYAPNVVVHGNLLVVGSSSNITTANTVIYDNFITLNEGDAGPGVTLGNSGIQINRGSLPTVQFAYYEAANAFVPSMSGAQVNIQSGIAVNNNDVITKTYLTTYGVPVGGASGGIAYNKAGNITSDSNFVYDFANGNVSLGNITLSNLSIITTKNNADLVINAVGTGTTYLQDVLKIQMQGVAAPSNINNTVQLFANAPKSGQSGLFVVNNVTASTELVTKKRSLLLSLVFG